MSRIDPLNFPSQDVEADLSDWLMDTLLDLLNGELKRIDGKVPITSVILDDIM